MNIIRLKYKIKDTVVYKLNTGMLVSTGQIENFLVSSNRLGAIEVCYYIRNKSTNKMDTVNENSIIRVANNVVNKEVMSGAIAEAYAEGVLKKLDLGIKILKIQFDGNKTAVSYRVANSDTVKMEISECHVDDVFIKEKGVLACLCRISIKLLQEKIHQI